MPFPHTEGHDDVINLDSSSKYHLILQERRVNSSGFESKCRRAQYIIGLEGDRKIPRDVAVSEGLGLCSVCRSIATRTGHPVNECCSICGASWIDDAARLEMVDVTSSSHKGDVSWMCHSCLSDVYEKMKAMVAASPSPSRVAMQK